jgi:YHS domain-containing protein
MRLRNLALAVALAAPLSFSVLAAQDTKKADEKPAKEVADPVCGMMVDPTNAPKSEYKGKSYYFCSVEEKKEFDKAPASYIKTDKKDTTKK